MDGYGAYDFAASACYLYRDVVSQFEHTLGDRFGADGRDLHGIFDLEVRLSILRDVFFGGDECSISCRRRRVPHQ